MQNKLKPATAICTCVPAWFNAMVTASDQNHCVHCDVLLDKNKTDDFVPYSLMMPCQDYHKRVHTYSIMVHPQCVEAFWKQQATTQHDRYYLRIDMHGTDIPISKQDGLLKQCVREHVRTGRMCPQCKTWEEEHTKFLSCGGCLRVRYCTESCQHAHWSTHKTTCKRRQRKRAQLNKMKLTSNVTTPFTTEPCSCLTRQEQQWFQRQDPKQCSYHTCTHSVPDTLIQKISHHVVSCRLPLEKQRQLVHMIPKTYCKSHRYCKK